MIAVRSTRTTLRSDTHCDVPHRVTERSELRPRRKSGRRSLSSTLARDISSADHRCVLVLSARWCIARSRSALAVALSGVLFAACSDSSGPKTGALDVTVTGLPVGTNGALSVTGPSGYAQSLTAGQSLPSLAPGTYTIAASSVTDASGTYAPLPASQTAAVAAGTVHATASVSYTLITGGLTVTVTALPSGAPAAVTITGPGGFSQALTATTTLIKLTPANTRWPLRR